MSVLENPGPLKPVGEPVFEELEFSLSLLVPCCVPPTAGWLGSFLRAWVAAGGQIWQIQIQDTWLNVNFR